MLAATALTCLLSRRAKTPGLFPHGHLGFSHTMGKRMALLGTKVITASASSCLAPASPVRQKQHAYSIASVGLGVCMCVHGTRGSDTTGCCVQARPDIACSHWRVRDTQHRCTVLLSACTKGGMTRCTHRLVDTSQNPAASLEPPKPLPRVRVPGTRLWWARPCLRMGSHTSPHASGPHQNLSVL